MKELELIRARQDQMQEQGSRRANERGVSRRLRCEREFWERAVLRAMDSYPDGDAPRIADNLTAAWRERWAKP